MAKKNPSKELGDPRLVLALLDSSDDGVFVTDRAGQVLAHNDAVSRILGCPPLGAKPELAAMLEPAGLFEIWRELRRDLEPGTTRITHREVGGRPVLVRVVGLEGLILTRLGFARTAAPIRLGRGEELFQALAEVAPVGIYLTDAKGDCLHANRRWLEMAGMGLEQALGQGWVEAIHPDDRQRVFDTWHRTVDAGGRWGSELRFRRPDGVVTWVYGVAAKVLDEHGEVQSYLGVNLDITARRQAEEQLRHSQKMEAVGRLAGGIAHDFNNLLTVILGTVEFVVDTRAVDSDLAREMRDIRHAAEQAASLTKQLLAFSRRQVLEPELLSLNEVVLEMSRMFGRIIGEDIAVDLRLAEQLGEVVIDRSQAGQVLLNLVVNARDAMPGGGRLTIQTRNRELGAEQSAEALPAGSYVSLSVADDGEGMDPEVLGNVFTPFFTTKKEHGGSGLGLSTVHGIVRQSGGDIRVTSERGVGSIFELLLPFAAESRRRARAQEKAQGEGERSGHILLVEDEVAVRTVATRLLRRRGYEVTECSDAEEALSRAGDLDFDVLVTDVTMPGMSGVELAETLRRQRPEIGVLFVSGYTESAGSLGDIEVFLQKPFTSDTLLRAIDRARENVR